MLFELVSCYSLVTEKKKTESLFDVKQQYDGLMVDD